MPYLQFGQAFPDLAFEHLRFDASRALLGACHRHPDVHVRELRTVAQPGESVADGIVIDIDNRQVPARNPSGIRPRERLLLLHREGVTLPYDVRPLRDDFPVLLHQNAVRDGEPLSLCLYERPWSDVARSWTPARFLARVFWWLGRSARGELHAPDQDLEQLFYDDGMRVVLPQDFESKWLATSVPVRLAQLGDGSSALRPIAAVRNPGNSIVGLVVSIDTVGHPPLSRQPATLGSLVDHFAALSSDLLEPLAAAVAASWPEGAGARPNTTLHTMVILRVPRDTGSGLPRIDTSAVLLKVDPGGLGVMLGSLDAEPGTGRVFRSYGTTLSGRAPTRSSAWRNVPVAMAQVASTISRSQARRYSGIADSMCDFRGVLAGVGALGSAMFALWVREGWGEWTLIDADSVSPHNLVRHLAMDFDIGFSKVSVCADAAAAMFPSEPRTATITARVEAENAGAVLVALMDAELVVDATAALSTERDLSASAHAARTASVFLSPSGRSSVLLLEDRGRQLRLLELEAQYYRAILNAPWGATHLAAEGVVRPGATCRDVSFVLSPERVQVHAAILSEQLRLSVVNDAARISIWTLEADGGVTHLRLPVAEGREHRSIEWTIGWDTELRSRLRRARAEQLPQETGGVLLGIIDTALKRIQIVDLVCAPVDSTGSEAGFTCGVQGLAEIEAEAGRRTHGAVEYIGHWHSHPVGHSAQPSLTDLTQASMLAEQLDVDDIPGLVCIVGEDEEDLSWTLGRKLWPADLAVVRPSAPIRVTTPTESK